MMQIRLAVDSDFPAMWTIFHAVVSTGSTYVFAADTPAADARAYWFGPGVTAYVAEDDGRIVGMYKIVANQRDRGAHVANASFMVDPACAGRGIGRRLGIDCLHKAQQAGYTAMQFNFVVSTNTAAVRLWQQLGFAIVGTLPGAFMHQERGAVDAFVMHRFLTDLPVQP